MRIAILDKRLQLAIRVDKKVRNRVGKKVKKMRYKSIHTVCEYRARVGWGVGCTGVAEIQKKT